MPALTRANNFVTGGTILAAEVNEDLDDLFAAVNSDLIHADGTNAFTAVPAGPDTDPSTDNQLTRKKYVDAAAGGVVDKKTLNTSSAYATFAAGAATNTWYPMSASLTISVAEITDHWYKSTLIVPALACTEDAESSSNINRIAGGVKRDGSEVSRSWVVHDKGDDGATCIAIAYRKATTDETVDWACQARHSRSDTTGLAYSSGGNSLITHIVEDVGLSL